MLRNFGILCAEALCTAHRLKLVLENPDNVIQSKACKANPGRTSASARKGSSSPEMSSSAPHRFVVRPKRRY